MMSGGRIEHSIVNGTEGKICSRCGHFYPLEFYYFSKITSDGLRSACKACERRDNAAAYAKNPQYHQERIAKWRSEHPERIKKVIRLRYMSEKRKAWCREWRKRNPEKIKEYSKRRNAKYAANGYWSRVGKEKRTGPNREKYLAISRRATAKRRSTFRGVLDHRMNTALRLALNGSKDHRKWSDSVGYSTSELIARLNETMPAGYSWNRINELHIDHIIPKSFFQYTNPDDDQFRECWGLNNLQLLPAIENIKKSNRVAISQGG